MFMLMYVCMLVLFVVVGMWCRVSLSTSQETLDVCYRQASWCWCSGHRCVSSSLSLGSAMLHRAVCSRGLLKLCQILIFVFWLVCTCTQWRITCTSCWWYMYIHVGLACWVGVVNGYHRSLNKAGTSISLARFSFKTGIKSRPVFISGATTSTRQFGHLTLVRSYM